MRQNPNSLEVAIKISTTDRSFTQSPSTLHTPFQLRPLYTNTLTNKLYTTAMAEDSVGVNTPPTTPTTTMMIAGERPERAQQLLEKRQQYEFLTLGILPFDRDNVGADHQRQRQNSCGQISRQE